MTTTTATISQRSERAGNWMAIYGSRTIPIRSIIPEHANLPGFDEPQLVYLVALEKLTAEQRANVVAHIAQRFNIPPAEIEADLDQIGLPILADDVTVTTDMHPLAFIDDFDDDDNWDTIPEWWDDDEDDYLNPMDDDEWEEGWEVHSP